MLVEKSRQPVGCCAPLGQVAAEAGKQLVLGALPQPGDQLTPAAIPQAAGLRCPPTVGRQVVVHSGNTVSG